MSSNSTSNESAAKSKMTNVSAFSDFVTRLLAVPHSEIKAKLDAEREAKRISKSASRVSGVPSKHT